MISNKGFLAEHITLLCPDEQTSGAVAMKENDTCGNAVDNQEFLGVMTNNRNGVAAVQVKGYAEIGYTGDNVEVGIKKVCCNGEGGIKVSENGREVIVLSVDTASNTVTIIM